MDTVRHDSLLMLHYAGSTTVRQSPLVIQVLQNDTTPRDYAIYLQSKAKTSIVDCGVPIGVEAMYSNEFQRQFFSQITLETHYNLTFLQNYELVAPVIDCSFSGLLYNDRSALRLFYFMRALNDTEVDRSIVRGSTLLATVVFLGDLTATDVQHHFILAIDYPFVELSFQVYEYVSTTPDSYWVLASVPTSASEVSRQVMSSCRQGTFVHNEREHANTENTIWELSTNALQVLSEFQYIGRPTLRNSWAWVHAIHVFLALDMLFHLLLIIAIASNHARRYGLFWLGDAFVALHSRLWILLPIVLISWCIEGFWSIVELCIHDGNAITMTQSIFIYESIMRVDLMTICFSLADLIGRVAGESIEPAFGLGIFYVAFEQRLSILQWSPVFTDIVTTYTDADYSLALRTDPEVSLITRWS